MAERVNTETDTAFFGEVPAYVRVRQYLTVEQLISRLPLLDFAYLRITVSGVPFPVNSLKAKIQNGRQLSLQNTGRGGGISHIPLDFEAEGLRWKVVDGEVVIVDWQWSLQSHLQQYLESSLKCKDETYDLYYWQDYSEWSAPICDLFIGDVPKNVFRENNLTLTEIYPFITSIHAAGRDLYIRVIPNGDKDFSMSVPIRVTANSRTLIEVGYEMEELIKIPPKHEYVGPGWEVDKYFAENLQRALEVREISGDNFDVLYWVE